MKPSTLSRLLLSASAVATLVLAPLSASAYGSLVIFGDSLSDSGNIAALIGTDPAQIVSGNSYVPSAPYGSGTFSNGEVWATGFASALGLAADPSRTGGTNYAHGGAVTRGFGLPTSLRGQVTQYLNTGAAGAADTLYVIAGGGNNARNALEAIAGGAAPQLTIAQTASRFADDVGVMVDALQAAGAQDIVVWTTPDIGLVPAINSLGAEASFLGSTIASFMNGALAERLVGETGVYTFDTFGLLNQIAADPLAFGLSNVSDACGALAGCDVDTFLFWDGIHPTSAGHAILRDGMLATVAAIPEPGSALLFLAGGAGLLAWRRRRA